jgi:hypothetical protein
MLGFATKPLAKYLGANRHGCGNVGYNAARRAPTSQGHFLLVHLSYPSLEVHHAPPFRGRYRRGPANRLCRCRPSPIGGKTQRDSGIRLPTLSPYAPLGAQSIGQITKVLCRDIDRRIGLRVGFSARSMFERPGNECRPQPNAFRGVQLSGCGAITRALLRV